MDWDGELKKLWGKMTFAQAIEMYTPVLVHALSNLAPGKMGESDAEDIVVAITRETFIGVEKVFRFLPHEVAFIDEMTQLATVIAREIGFLRFSDHRLVLYIVEARFEHILRELAEKIEGAPAEDIPKLMLARKRILELFLQWSNGGNGGRPPGGNNAPPGTAPVGAPPTPPRPRIAPAMGRTISEARELPRNP
jgi:hypothetical protein